MPKRKRQHDAGHNDSVDMPMVFDKLQQLQQDAWYLTRDELLTYILKSQEQNDIQSQVIAKQAAIIERLDAKDEIIENLKTTVEDRVEENRLLLLHRDMLNEQNIQLLYKLNIMRSLKVSKRLNTF
jgi:hypothetical protein